MNNTAVRDAKLWHMLSDRRRALQDDLQSHIHDGRNDRQTEPRDEVDDADVDTQGDIRFALLQVKADTLTRIDQALVRLDAGRYGSCVECEGQTAEQRLRALPFAVRCRACEERREGEQTRARHRARQRGALSLFPDVASAR